MMLMPSFPKKHFAFAIGFATFAIGAIALRNNIVDSKNNSNTLPAQEQKFSVTVDQYKTDVQSLVAGVKLDDVQAMKVIIEKLVAMRVPREAMLIHQELVTSFYAYRESLTVGTASAKKNAHERLEVFEQNNSWLDISL